MSNSAIDLGDVKELEKLLIENLGLIDQLKLMGKLGRNITKKHIFSPLNKTLQKSWKIATWGSHSPYDYAHTIKYKAVNFATAAPISLLSFGKMVDKLTHDCSFISFSCEIAPSSIDAVTEYVHPVIALLGTSAAVATATTAYLATRAFNRAVGDSLSSSAQIVSNIVDDTISVVVPTPISAEAREVVEKIRIEERAEKQRQALFTNQEQAALRAQKQAQLDERLAQQKRDLQRNQKEKERLQRDAQNPTKQSLKISSMDVSFRETVHLYVQQQNLPPQKEGVVSSQKEQQRRQESLKISQSSGEEASFLGKVSLYVRQGKRSLSPA